MPQEKTYTITLTATQWNSICATVNEAMSVKVWLPILNEIDRQAKEQDAKEAKKEELTKVAEQIAPKKKVSKK